MTVARYFAVAIIVCGSVSIAQADPLTIVNEWDVSVGDTGDIPSSAVTLLGDGSLTQINGRIDADGRRVDMYGIYLSTTDLFAAYTEITDGDRGELSVFLFDDEGRGVVGAKQGQRLANIVPAYTGLHYLAVAQGQTLEPSALIDPIHNSTLPIFTTNTAYGYHIPGGAAADLPVTSWGGGISGNYRAYSIYLRGANFVPIAVPEPGTLALLGLGLVGMAARRRRRLL